METKMKKKKIATLAASLLVFGALAFTATSCGFLPEDEENKIVDKSGLKLVWSDEFDSGTTPSTSKWTKEIWNPGKVNNEKQYYTDSEKTAYISDGTLKIKAYKENGNWYSARIKTEKKASWKYGLFEAKIKMPAGNGVWPAFWMMPEDSAYGTWPRSGELDIMEYSPSTTKTRAYSTVHHSASESQASTDSYKSLGGKELPDAASAWHTYSLRWTEDYVEAFIDGASIGSKYYNDGKGWVNWPYDKPYYIILNLAMGGTLGGAIDSSLTEAVFEIDYVRVYQ